jgi:hypothetical protein
MERGIQKLMSHIFFIAAGNLEFPIITPVSVLRPLFSLSLVRGFRGALETVVLRTPQKPLTPALG